MISVAAAKLMISEACVGRLTPRHEPGEAVE
jgi:hypothetical protein